MLLGFAEWVQSHDLRLTTLPFHHTINGVQRDATRQVAAAMPNLQLSVFPDVRELPNRFRTLKCVALTDSLIG